MATEKLDQTNSLSIGTEFSPGVQREAWLMENEDILSCRSRAFIRRTDMPRLTYEERALRRLNKPVNRELRRAGLPVPISHRAHRVVISAILMPEWASRLALRGFTRTKTSVVLKARRDAAELVRLDQAKGGKPTLERFEYRRCNACRPALGAN